MSPNFAKQLFFKMEQISSLDLFKHTHLTAGEVPVREIGIRQEVMKVRHDVVLLVCTYVLRTYSTMTQAKAASNMHKVVAGCTPVFLSMDTRDVMYKKLYIIRRF